MIRRLLLAACPLLTLAAASQDVPPAPTTTPTPTPSPTRAYATVSVTVTTSEGPIVVALERERAPITTANFLRYVDAKQFDNTFFYRAMAVGDTAGLVQGGVRNRSDLIFPPIAHEPTSKTGLTHDDGAISLARAAPGSGRGDFFIVVGSVPTLDANPAAAGDKLGYAAFGHVTAGMDIVRRILRAPTKADGPPGMKGQILSAPVKIVSVRRVVAKR